MRPLWYCLDGKEAVPVKGLVGSDEWLKAMLPYERGIGTRVAQTALSGGVWVSTTFIALNHSFFEGPPLIFETMVFRDGKGCEQDRYSTWAEAETGHMEMLDLLEAQGHVSTGETVSQPMTVLGKPSRRSSGPPRRVRVRARQSRADARRRKRQSARP